MIGWAPVAIRGRLQLAVQPAGLIVYAGAQWMLFAWFLARGGLASGGDFALAQGFAAPVFAFMSLSLRQLWVSRADGAGHYGRLVMLRFVTTLLAIGVVLALAAVTDARIAVAPFAFVLFIKAQEALADIFYAGMDARGRNHVAGLLLGTKGAVIASAVAAGFLFGLPAGVLGAIVASGCAAVLLIEMMLARPRFDAGTLAVVKDWRGADPLLAGIGWLSLANLMVAVTGFLPRYALDIVTTRAAVGLFAAVMMPVTMLLLVATGLSQSSLLDLTRMVRSRDRRGFARVLGARAGMLVLLTVAAAAAMAIAGATPLPALAGVAPDLLGTAAGVTLLMTPAMIAQIVSYAYLPLRNFRTLSAINALALAISAALAWPLLTLHPIYGAAILACVPSLVQLAAFGTGLHRHFARNMVTA